MKKNSITKNYIYNVLYEILVMIIPLVTIPYLSRVLGAENIGIYSYTISITTYFILAGSLGVAMYGKREIAYVQDNIEKRTQTLYEILIMRFITLGISMLLFYLTFCISGQYSTYYRILLFEIIAGVLDISWYFQGLEEFKKTVFRNTLVKIVSLICIFIFVKTSNDLNNYFIIYVFSTLLGNISLWLYIPKYTTKLKIKEMNIIKHVKPTIMLFIPQIATQVYTVLDKTMIGAIITDKSEVGYYEQAQKITKLLLMIATSFGTVMMPRIAATYSKGNTKKVKEYMSKSFAFIMMLTFPLMFGIISVAYKFVPIFYGAGYDKVAPLLCLTSPIIILIGLSNVTGTQYLLPTKQQNKYTISVVIGALVNFLLNLLLIKNFASIGASIATVAAEFVVTVIQFVLIRKEINILDVFKRTYKYLIASIIMFFCSVAIGWFISNNLISIIVQIIVAASVYFVLLFLLKDELIFEGIEKINNKVKFGKRKVHGEET